MSYKLETLGRPLHRTFWDVRLQVLFLTLVWIHISSHSFSFPWKCLVLVWFLVQENGKAENEEEWRYLGIFGVDGVIWTLMCQFLSWRTARTFPWCEWVTGAWWSVVLLIKVKVYHCPYSLLSSAQNGGFLTLYNVCRASPLTLSGEFNSPPRPHTSTFGTSYSLG